MSLRLATLSLVALLAGCAPYRPSLFVPVTYELPHPCGFGLSPMGERGSGCPEHYACRREACEFMGWDWAGPGT